MGMTIDQPDGARNLYVFSAMVELVALHEWRRSQQRNAIPSDFIPLVPPLNAAGLSQRDNRYR